MRSDCNDTQRGVGVYSLCWASAQSKVCLLNRQGSSERREGHQEAERVGGGGWHPLMQPPSVRYLQPAQNLLIGHVLISTRWPPCRSQRLSQPTGCCSVHCCPRFCMDPAIWPCWSCEPARPYRLGVMFGTAALSWGSFSWKMASQVDQCTGAWAHVCKPTSGCLPAGEGRSGNDKWGRPGVPLICRMLQWCHLLSAVAS